VYICLLTRTRDPVAGWRCWRALRPNRNISHAQFTHRSSGPRVVAIAAPPGGAPRGHGLHIRASQSEEFCEN